VKTHPAGHPVGYDRTFTTGRPTRVALLPVGYADGYRRAWSHRSCVLVNGRRAPAIGTLSMDCTAVDVTDAGEVDVGREVVQIGRDGDEAVTAEELAGLVPGLTPYKIITSFGKRVVRSWHSGKQVSAAA
jgi:alanine racemase